ncbi:MAG TPA: non-canonical purine NTP pyrophosphatase, partial [Polyangiales bacterium]|nr:non-canonical purine NTP pyrophosphatase [Polyangiales bacterium]
MSEILSLVLATGNAGKLSELRALLAGLPVRVLSQPEALGTQLAIEETGDTFAQNAALKAHAVCRAAGLAS